MTTLDPATGIAAAEDGSEPRVTDSYEIVESLRAIVMSNTQQRESGLIERFRRATAKNAKLSD